MVFTKQTVKLLPETVGPFNPADTTTFRIANMAKAIDPRTVFLHFHVQTFQDITLTPPRAADQQIGTTDGSGTGIFNEVPQDMTNDPATANKPSYVIIDDSGHSLLKTVTCRLGGGFQQDRVTDYNRMHNMLSVASVPEAYKRGFLGRAQGYHPRGLDETRDRISAASVDYAGLGNEVINVGTARPIYSAPATSDLEVKGSVGDYYQNVEAAMQGKGKWISIPLDCMSMFSQEKFIYLPAVGGEINIDILWEDANKVLFSPTTPDNAPRAPFPSYRIGQSNWCYISYDVVSLTEAYVVGLTRALSSGGINYDTEKYYVQKFTTTPGPNAATEFRIQKRFQSAKSAWVFFNEIKTGAGNEYLRKNKTSQFSTCGITRYQFVVDGIPVSHPIELGSYGNVVSFQGSSVGGVFPLPGGPARTGSNGEDYKRYSEAVMEFAKSLRLSADLTVTSGLQMEAYGCDNDAGQVASPPASHKGLCNQHFIAGVDLERTGAELSGRGMDEIVFTGDFTAQAGTELYFAILYDSRLVVEAGSRFTLVE